MGQDYYELLGVSKNANSDEIKKQYKKMAMKYHPDRNKENKEEAAKKFQEISNAYNVLTDPQKKNIYDQCGEEGLKQGGGGGVDPFTMFQEMFGEGGMPGMGGMGGFSFGNMGGNMGHRNKENHEVKRMSVSLEDLYNGKTVKFNITHSILKNNKSNSIKKCPHCNGSGVEIKIHRMGPIIQQMQSECGHCNGTGKIVDSNCMEKVSKKITVPIEKGMCNGEKIVVKGLGNFNVHSMKNDDLIFIINEQEHNIFKRVDNDLVVGLDINLVDSLVGFKFEFTHLDGSKFLIESNQIIKQDDIKVVKNKGMPYNSRAEVFGDLIFKFNIIYPNSIDFSNINKIKSVLPSSIFKPIMNSNLDTFKLSQYKKKQNEQQNHQPNNCHQQ